MQILKRHFTGAALLACAGLLLGCVQQESQSEASAEAPALTTPADLVITNGKVVTLDSKDSMASAFAVKDGTFLAVGDALEMQQYIGEQTKVIDVNGRTVIPGLDDSHTHVVRGGLNYNAELRWDGVRSLKTALAMLKEQAERTPKGQWVKVVGGWTEHQFEEKRLPTLEEINEAAPDTPVFLLYLYSLGYMNKAGIEALGYDKDTYYPGGEIELDEQGNVTGFLVAKPSALLLYSTLVKTPKLTPEQQYNSSLHMYKELNRLAMTSAVDAGGGGQHYPENYQISQKLADNGDLTVRVAHYLFATVKGKETELYAKWVKPKDGIDSIKKSPVTELFTKHDAKSLVKVNGYMPHGAGENIVWAAADFENFLEPRPELVPGMEDELRPMVELFAKNRWPFRIHATYNESITRFLDIFEEVNSRIPFDGLRFVIDHAETIDDNNLQRIKALGGGIAVQNRMMFQGEYFVERYGADVAKHTPPLRKMLDMGIPVGLGTDGTRVSSYNPWLSLYWAVSGKTWGGLSLYDEDNRLTRSEALRLMTQGSAWLSGEETVKGAIEPGKFADFAVLTDDFMTVDEEAIKNIHSVLTVVAGDTVYGEQEFTQYDRVLPEIIPAWAPAKYYGGYQHPKP